jgi:cysteinyl-tRNA synthetase
MKIPIEEYQEIDFNEDYIKYSKNQMNGIKSNLEKLITDYNQFKKQINNFLKNFENCFPDLLNEVDCCLYWLKYTKNYNAKKAKNIKKNKIFIKNILKNAMLLYIILIKMII